MELEKRTLTIEMAIASGFDHAGYAEIEKMEFLTEIREMCEVNRCGKYNTNWSCPPACGSLEEITERVKSYDYAMILQATEAMEDDYDWEGIQRAQQRCDQSLKKLARELRESGKTVLAMGAGGCSKCKDVKCTYPDLPCRFPEELNYSMEACGLFVSKECEKAGMKYYYGPKTMTINATIFVKED